MVVSNSELISSIISSAVQNSLSEKKSAPKKKKKTVALSKATASSTTIKPEAVAAAVHNKPEAAATAKRLLNGGGEWTEVKKKKNGSPSTGTKTVPAVAPVLKAASKDALASNAFHVPKKLEKHLHKSTTRNLVAAKLPSPSNKENANLTKSQRKHHLRAMKRAAKQEEKRKVTNKATTVETEKAKIPVKEESDTRSAQTTATVFSSEDDAAVSSGNFALLSLPYEVLTNGIFSFLRPEEMSSLSACSKYAKELSEAGFLWQALFRQRFPASELTPKSMKEWKLAYQLSLTKIVYRLRCPTTKQTFLESTIGVGVNFTVNPQKGSVDYIELSQDLLSQTAFCKHKIRQDVFGNEFELFLPLFFSASHFQRALPQIERTVAKLAWNRKEGPIQAFKPSFVLDVFPKIITTLGVLISDNGVAACRKTYESLIRIHRLFLALAQHYPNIQKEALRRLQHFVSRDENRVKQVYPNLGSIVPLIMIVDEDKFCWNQLRVPYMGEVFDRMMLWCCKNYPRLQRTQESANQAEERVKLTLDAGKVTLRLLMINVYFFKSLCRGSVQARANRYDSYFGQGDSTIQFSHFRDQINRIMVVDSWHGFFACMEMPRPNSKTEMARRLRCHVINSARKGYHKQGMDFSRVQASGRSNILSKGEQYNADSNLRRVVFRDDWGFKGTTKYLDATCLLYRGKNLLETVDFRHRVGSNGSVTHSGDVMADTTGSHTIRLNLETLGKHTTSCVFVLSAYAEATLADIKSPSVSFSNEETGEVLCTYNLDAQDKVSYLTSVIMCRLYRVNGGWHVQAVGDAHKGAADNYRPIYDAVRKLL